MFSVSENMFSLSSTYRIAGRRRGLLVGVCDVRVEVPFGDRHLVHEPGVLLIVLFLQNKSQLSTK